MYTIKYVPLRFYFRGGLPFSFCRKRQETDGGTQPETHLQAFFMKLFPSPYIIYIGAAQSMRSHPDAQGISHAYPKPSPTLH